jgi:hypothetical protein
MNVYVQRRTAIVAGLVLALGLALGLTSAATAAVIIHDELNDGDINTNTAAGGVGDGFNQGGNLVRTIGGEVNDIWFVGPKFPPDPNASFNFDKRWLTSKDADEFNPQTLPTRIEWQASYADVHIQRTIPNGPNPPFPGIGDGDIRHQFGLVSANRTNDAVVSPELWENFRGGVYVNLFYDGANGGANPETATITGNLRVATKNKAAFDDNEFGPGGSGDPDGLVTVGSFSFNPRDLFVGQGPDDVVVRLDTNALGFAVSFFEADGITPLLPATLTGLLAAPWAAIPSYLDAEVISITDEFANGAFVSVMAQMVHDGRGFMDLGRVTVIQIPEPASLLLVLSGGLALMIPRRARAT